MIAVEVNAAAGDINAAKSVANRALEAVSASMPKDALAAASFHLGEIFRDAKARVEAAYGAGEYAPLVYVVLPGPFFSECNVHS